MYSAVGVNCMGHGLLRIVYNLEGIDDLVSHTTPILRKGCLHKISLFRDELLSPNQI